jgi:hypothetical protein
MSLSRRGFLKGSALGGAAVVLGWRPSLPVAPAVAPVVAETPVASVPGIVKLSSWIPVSNELMEDMPAIESYVRDRLTKSLTAKQDELILRRCLDERFESTQQYGDVWVRNQTAFRLTQEWEVTVTPELAAKMAAEAMA